MTQTKKIFFDYAAATPLDADVFELMRPYFSDKFYNPSAVYLDSRAVHADIEAARHKVSQAIGSRPDEVIFTAGATESCNLAIKGIMSQFPDSNVVVSSIEHAAVTEPAKNFDHKFVGVNYRGLVEVNELQKTIDDKTVLVSIMQANNEIGTVQPLAEIAAMIKEIRQKRKAVKNDLPIWLHSDASQAANYLDVHVARLGIDLLTLNGGKIYGPKQSGVLYVRAGVRILPIIDGGGQEWGLRSGTENVANIVGFAAALEKAQVMKNDESKRLRAFRKKLFDGILEVSKTAEINGCQRYRLPNNVNVSFPGVDGERLVMLLDEKGIQVATGAACSANSGESSHVIKALDRTEEQAAGSLRISLGRQTSEEEIDEVLVALTKALQEVKV